MSPKLSTKSDSVFALAALVVVLFSGGGCRLLCCANPYGPPPPPERVRRAPEREPIYYAPSPSSDAPGVRVYSPEPPSPGLDVAVDVRGQAPDDGSFPTIDANFPTLDDEPLAPPTSSELSDLARTGTSVPDPVGEYESGLDETAFRPEPKRESLAEREARENELEESYDKWRKERKKGAKSDSKTPRYLQPIADDNDKLFEREKSEDASGENRAFMRRVTADSLIMMQDEEEYRRELYDWEKETPTPIDWSKYNLLSLDSIRSWFGMGPDEKAALEYMRQACLKQNEYNKTKDKKTLREAAVLYEKAAKRWPGPALRPNEAKKNPFKAPKSGTLIEEDGLFFAGECWFFAHDFPNALSCYRALVQTYNASIYKNIATRRLLFIGNYWVKCSEKELANAGTDRTKPVFGTFSGAVRAYEAIFLNDVSDSGLAPEALFALANAYMRRGVKQGDGSFDSAAFYYKQLYENYPGHKRAEEASRLAMIALHRSYLGPFYDAQPLDEARRLAETIIKSGRGNTEVAYEELEIIKEEQAKRLLTLGQYYERRGNYASARNYYNRLVKEHPNSEYASLGAQAYGEIESKPAEADQLAWIRPIAPFLPKMTNEYFEEAPAKNLSEIARRDSRLDRIGEKDYSTETASTSRRSEELVETADDAESRPIIH